MSDARLFTKSKSIELRAEIEQAFKKSKPINRIKIVLRKVLANVILNNHEMATLMKDVIPLMKLDDLEIRKICCEYIVNYAHLSPDTQQAVPFLQRFKDEHSPNLRALAVKTMSSINLPEFMDLSFASVKRALKDKDPYVKRSAVYAIAKLYQHDPARTEGQSLVDELNELLYENDSIIISDALAALSSITESSKTLNLSIDKAHSLTLISLLRTTNEWQQIYLLNALMAYVPQTETEALDLIEAALPSLQHENSAVVLNAVKIIIYYSNYTRNPELHIPVLPKRIGASLNSLLSKPSETQFLVLRNVILLLLGKKHLVQFDIEMFYCRFDDPIYVKDTKLEIIYLLANEDNIESVLDELEEYATEVDVAMARKAIRAFGNLAVKLENAAERCVEVLCGLISTGVTYIVQEAAIVVKNIVRRYPRRYDYAVDELVKYCQIFEEPDAKASMIWMVGQFCKTIPNPKKHLFLLMTSFTDDPIEVQLAVLTAVTKYYLTFPLDGESTLLEVLKWATELTNNPDVRDRGYIYWRLLSSEYATSSQNGFQEITKDIVFNQDPRITSENDSIDPAILEELELNFGSLASIYLKPVQSVFRLAKHKHLQWSPALQTEQSSSSSREFASPKPSYIQSRTSSTSTNSRKESHSVKHNIRNSRDDISTQSFSPKPPVKENFGQKLSRKSSSVTGKIANKISNF
ncbi:hypothetical protein KGF57_001212 [Candida theae]|uniref:AP complex subunit beta n=1 Tax=Candida theae TaxID=1198502 RepID=A0AAD5BHW8_9ASCO|nr:uncharacterized protein KGF57_001212 [Candida theae]KAI5963837.1 hypothetical protein KGF57_001212 [Candida theae]